MKILLLSLLSVVIIAVAVFLVANQIQSNTRIQTLEQSLQLKDQENQALQSKYDQALNQISSLQQANNKTNDALNSVTTDLGTMAAELATTKSELDAARKSSEKDHGDLVMSQENLALLSEIHPASAPQAAATPSTPPPPPVVPPPPIPMAEVNANSVLIRGDKQMGLGFFATLKGAPTLVTVQEVLNGNTQFDVQMGDGKTTFKPAILQSASDSGLVSMHADSPAKGLTLLDNIDKNVSAGDAVLVIGNPGSPDTAAPIKGTIASLGPKLIELNAKFPPSYSGSPVYHIKSGKLIAIAAFSIMNTWDTQVVDKPTKITPVAHQYAYRLDTAPSWQPLNWATFTQEGLTLQAIIDRTNSIRDLYNDIYTHGRVSYGDYSNEGNILKSLVSDVETKLKGEQTSSDEYLEAKTDFINSVMDLCENDLTALTTVAFSSYHQSRLNEEIETRHAIEKNYRRLLAIQDNTRAFGYPHPH